MFVKRGKIYTMDRTASSSLEVQFHFHFCFRNKNGIGRGSNEPKVQIQFHFHLHFHFMAPILFWFIGAPIPFPFSFPSVKIWAPNEKGGTYSFSSFFGRAKVCIKSPCTVVWFSQIVYFLNDYQRLCKQLPKFLRVQIPLKIGQHLCPVKAVLRNKCYNLIILSSWYFLSW